VTRTSSLMRRFWRQDDGTSTVEFVIAVPLVLTLLFSAVDFGAVMLRQVFLDRSVDIAVRQVRLGSVGPHAHAQFRQMICDGTILISDCTNRIAVEMRPIDTTTWAGLDAPAQCVNRAEDIEPVLRAWVEAVKPGGYLILYLPMEELFKQHCEATGQTYNKHHHQNWQSAEDFLAQLPSWFSEQMECVEASGVIGVYSFYVVLKKRLGPM